MYAVSDRFLAAVASSHTMVTRVAAMADGLELDGLTDLAVRDGAVTLDVNASALGRLEVELAEPTLIPTGATSPLSPFGFELGVWRGFRYRNGDEELAPLGVFPIQESAVAGRYLTTSIVALDRSQRVRDARFEDDYTIAAGTNVATGIQAMLTAQVPGLVFAFASTAFTTPLLTFPATSDPWDAAQQMARSIGCLLYFNGLGVCVLRDEPTFTGDPVWTIAEGEAGILVDLDLRLSRQTAYNKVIAYSENAATGAVFRGTATDTDPTSPTYYSGRFGRKPLFFPSPLFTSNAMATGAAVTRLSGVLGVAKSVGLSAVPNPALEAGDPFLATRSALSMVDEIHLADTIRTSLAPEPAQSIATRTRQTGAILAA